MVKVVYVINSLNVGGAQFGLVRLLEGLPSEQYDFTIIVLNGKQDIVEKKLPSDIEQICFNGSMAALAHGSHRCLAALRSADLIVGSLYHASLLSRLGRVVNPTATIANWQHSTAFKSSNRCRVFRDSSRLVDVVLADSQSVAAFLVDELGLPSESVYTVPIAGIRMDQYQPKIHRDTRPLTVGSIGQLSAAKGYDTLLQVADRLAAEDVEFAIAGDGDRYPALQAKREALGLDAVQFLGDIDDVPGFLGMLDIYVQPSRREGLCIAVLEAMAAGLPVVGSDVGGIGSNVEHGVSGLLCEPGAVSCFVEGVKAFANSPAKRTEFGKRGRNFVGDHYTQEILVDRFEEAVCP